MPPEVPPETPVITPPPEPPPPPPIDQVPAPPTSDEAPQPKDANERNLGLLMHLCPLAGGLLFMMGIPAGNLIAPLVFWLIKKNESRYIDAVGKEVVNFQGYLAIVWVLASIPFLGCLVMPLLAIAGFAALVLMVMAAIAVSDGKFYRYPWIYRVIK